MAKQCFLKGCNQGARGDTKSMVTVVIVGLLAVMLVLNFWYRPVGHTATSINKDLITLVDIFTRIDKRCKILSFDAQKNPINFLNVVTFKGSEVGSMNLAYPTQWEGPYLDKNLTIQNQEYQIVRTTKGYFITPGDGVLLPNDKVVGKDIILDEDADIAALSNDEGALMYDGKALAAPLVLSTNQLQKLLREDIGATGEDMVLKPELPVGVRLASSFAKATADKQDAIEG
ncbi:MAG: hypothetical protein NTX86_01450 [Candidatus Dependentiae bacterium]|nr:hypothetical protein [Candidatus Dependentiae bacterium]